jgi:hypothetical protein
MAIETIRSRANFVLYILLMIFLASSVVGASFDAAIPEESHYPHFNSKEELSIQQVLFGTSPQAFAVHIIGIHSEKSNSIIVNCAIIKNESGNTVQALTLKTTILANNSLSTINFNLISTLSSGEKYTVTLTTEKGNNFVSQTFTAP